MAATTQLVLVFMGSLATVATIGIFKDFGDKATTAVVSFAAAILWAFTGMSAFDVYVDEAATVSEPIYPLAYLGIGFAIIAAIYGLFALMMGVKSETEAMNPGDIM